MINFAALLRWSVLLGIGAAALTPLLSGVETPACQAALQKPLMPKGASDFAKKWQDQFAELAKINDPAKRRDAVRKHGWALFQMVTADASPRCAVLPFWLTWKSKFEVFNGKQTPRSAKSVGLFVAESAPTLSDDRPSAPGASSGDRVPFSSAHYSPGLDALMGRAAKTLAALPSKTASWDPFSLPNPGFDPHNAIVVKPIWWVPPFETTGPQKDMACVPLWTDSPPLGTGAYPPSEWPNYVIFSKSTNVQPNQLGACKMPNSQLVNNVPIISLKEIYSLPITGDSVRGTTPEAVIEAVESRAIAQVYGTAPNPIIAPDARVLLVGMHIISRELNTWTWNTYWWAPAAARTTGKHADNRPSGLAAGKQEPWSHYVMDASIDRAGPLDAKNQPVGAIFNPYQESALDNSQSTLGGTSQRSPIGGLASNCRTCHESAAAPFAAAANLRRVYIPGTSSPLNYAGLTRVGFLWSLSAQADNQFKQVLYKRLSLATSEERHNAAGKQASPVKTKQIQ